MTEEMHECPLCGKAITDEEDFCWECREIAENSYSAELLAHVEEAVPIPDSDEPEEETLNNEPAPKKSNKKLFIFVAIGIFLVLAVAGFSSYNIASSIKSEENELAFWQQSVRDNTPLSYSKYLVQYPDGKFVTEAEKKIRELRDAERKEWEELRSSKNVDALFTFLADHPETPYIREIKYAIDSLAWIATEKDNTADAYKAYLDNVNLGRYSGEYFEQAQEKYTYISQLRTVEGEELSGIKDLLSDFFKAFSSLDAKDIEKYTTPTLDYFFDAEYQDSKLIADSVKTALNKQKVKEITYVPLTDSIEVIQDNKGIYIINLSLKVEKTAIDRKKKKEVNSYPIKMELNNERQITSLTKLVK